MATAKRERSKRAKPQTAKKLRGRPILKTEKDGRLYAIALFEKMEEEIQEANGYSPYSAEAEGRSAQDPKEVMIYRTSPQMGTLAKWTGDVYQYGTPAAIAGFHVVLTDFISAVIEGAVPAPASDYYAEREHAGQLDPWGSVIYSNPEAAKAVLAKGETSYQITSQDRTRQQAKAEKLRQEARHG